MHCSGKDSPRRRRMSSVHWIEQLLGKLSEQTTCSTSLAIDRSEPFTRSLGGTASSRFSWLHDGARQVITTDTFSPDWVQKATTPPASAEGCVEWLMRSAIEREQHKTQACMFARTSYAQCISEMGKRIGTTNQSYWERLCGPLFAKVRAETTRKVEKYAATTPSLPFSSPNANSKLWSHCLLSVFYT